MRKGIWGRDCGERDAGRGLWGKGCKAGSVWKWMQGGDHGERDEVKGLWGKRCKAGSVWKWMQGGDHGGRDPGSLVSKDLKTNEISAAARKRQGLLLCGAGLVACFSGLAQHC